MASLTRVMIGGPAHGKQVTVEKSQEYLDWVFGPHKYVVADANGVGVMQWIGIANPQDTVKCLRVV
jgi:hypothetical protein